jgi:hypothetical protein
MAVALSNRRMTSSRTKMNPKNKVKTFGNRTTMIPTKKMMNWTSPSQFRQENARASEQRLTDSVILALILLIRRKLSLAVTRWSKSVKTLYSQKYFPKTNVQQKLNYFPYIVSRYVGYVIIAFLVYLSSNYTRTQVLECNCLPCMYTPFRTVSRSHISEFGVFECVVW